MYLHICPVCEHRNPRGSRFCNECGSPLQLRFCPACHAAADVLELKCHACGTPLPEVALTEAVDLPPAFAKWATQPPADPAVNRTEPPPQAVPRPAPDAREKTTRATNAPAKRPAVAEPAHAHAGPLTTPRFDPHGDPHAEGHGPIDPSPAATFAAAKTASIIERLYARQASPSAAEPDPPDDGVPVPTRERAPRVGVAAGLVVFAVVLGAIYFSLPSAPEDAAAPSATRPLPVAPATQAVFSPGANEDAQKTPPQHVAGEAIKGPANGSSGRPAAKPVGTAHAADAAPVRATPAANASAPSTTAELSPPPPAAAAVLSPQSPAAAAESAPAGATAAPAKEAQSLGLSPSTRANGRAPTRSAPRAEAVRPAAAARSAPAAAAPAVSPCTPAVAALGLCDLTPSTGAR